MTESPVLIVPGIGNSGPRHWQTLWQARHPEWQRVEQREWDRPHCDAWVQALDAAVAACAGPPLLIAHSLGCLTVVHWAGRSPRPVRALFLAAVPDPRSPHFPASAEGFDPLPLDRLPCASLVVASRNDPIGSSGHARRCATAWGSEFIDIGEAGHINVDSGHGAWPEGWALLSRLMQRAAAAAS